MTLISHLNRQQQQQTTAEGMQQQPYYGGGGYVEDPAAIYNGGMYQPAEMGYARECGRAKYQETEESKLKYRISLRDVLNGNDPRTTLMIKNIPNKYNQKMLLQKIDVQHKGQYNFFYLPLDFKVSSEF